MFKVQLLPIPISHLRVENLTRMEPINRFNQQSRVFTLVNPSSHNRFSRELHVSPIEILEGHAAADQILVNLIEFLSSLGGNLSFGGIGVQPSRAGGDLQAVQEVINVDVGSSDRVGSVPHGVVEEFTISETNTDDVRAGGEDSVEILEDSDDIFFELFDLGHGEFADIVTDKFQEQEDGVVVGLVSSKGVQDVVDFVTRGATIDTSVLVILEIALVSLEKILVKGVSGEFRGAVEVSSPARLHGQVEFIKTSGNEVIEGAVGPGGAVEPVRGKFEMGTDGVTNNSETDLSRVVTEIFLVGVASLGVSAINTVAVEVISLVRSGVDGSSGVDLSVTVITISALPVVASSLRGQSGEGVVVEVLVGSVVVGEGGQDGGEGLPRIEVLDVHVAEVELVSDEIELGGVVDAGRFTEAQVFGVVGEEVACGVVAKAGGSAGDVGGTVLVEGIDDFSAVGSNEAGADAVEGRGEDFAKVVLEIVVKGDLVGDGGSGGLGDEDGADSTVHTTTGFFVLGGEGVAEEGGPEAGGGGCC